MSMRNPLNNQKIESVNATSRRGKAAFFLHISEVLAACPWSAFGRVLPVTMGWK
jgi:hypothetical protein